MPPVDPPPPDLIEAADKWHPILWAIGTAIAGFIGGATKGWRKIFPRKPAETPSIAPPLPRPPLQADETLSDGARLGEIHRAVTMLDKDGNRVSSIRHLLGEQMTIINERFALLASSIEVIVQANADGHMAQARHLETMERMLSSTREEHAASHLATEGLRMVLREFTAALKEEKKDAN